MNKNQEKELIFDINSYLDITYALLGSLEAMQGTIEISKYRFKTELIKRISKKAIETIISRNLKIKKRKIKEGIEKLRDNIYNLLIQHRYLEEFLPDKDSLTKKIKVGPSYYEYII